MRKRHDTPETSRALFWLAFVLALVLAGISTQGEAQTVQRWAVNPSVKYDATGSPYSANHVEAAIEEAIWVWETSIPSLDINYVGLTLGPVENAVITFKWNDPIAHWNLTGNLLSKGAEQKWTYLDNGLIAKSVIFLNTAYFEGGIDACQMTVFSHEFGHALGLNGHSDNPDDLMYYATEHCRYVPTDNDVSLLGYQPTACHAILTRENDISVPFLGGFLKKQEGAAWELESLTSTSPRSCNTVTMDSQGVITMTDVRSITGNLSLVILSPIADNTWSLTWAE